MDEEGYEGEPDNPPWNTVFPFVQTNALFENLTLALGLGIPAGYGMVVPQSFTIPLGLTLTIGLGGVLQIL